MEDKKYTAEYLGKMVRKQDRNANLTIAIIILFLIIYIYSACSYRSPSNFQPILPPEILYILLIPILVFLTANKNKFIDLYFDKPKEVFFDIIVSVFCLFLIWVSLITTAYYDLFFRLIKFR